MIELHLFARAWEVPNLSPFCCKVETYLKMTGLEYEVVDAVPPLAPKGKLPYIKDGDGTIADSRFIIDYLKSRHQADLDADLSPSERAESLAFQQAIFGVIPPRVRDAVAAWARRRSRKQICGQGIGLHSTDEVYQLGMRDLSALSDFLADKAFFLGDAPTTLDASAYGLLTCGLWCPIESPAKEHAQGLENLVAFCERVRDRFFLDEHATGAEV